MKEKCDVILREPLNGWGYNDTKSIACSCISVKQAMKYVRSIASKGQIPEDSCLYKIIADLQFTNSAQILLSHDECIQCGDIKQKESGKLDITVIMTNGRKCSRTHCFENIRNGKCIDKFVIDIIGKKFFPEQYKNKNTRRRNNNIKNNYTGNYKRQYYFIFGL